MRTVFSLLILGIALTTPAQADVQRAWSFSEFGEPVHDASMAHWPYVNPDAPRGGSIVLGAFGTFDSLNPYLLKGQYASSIGMTMDSLMVSSGDDLLSVYGQIAKSVEYPEDISWAIFELRKEAHFDDGNPITAADFVFTFETIRDHGRPFLRAFYRDVEGVEVLGDHRLKFSFKTRGNRKVLANIAGLSPLPSHYWKDHDITKTTLKPWPSSGAYRIKSLDAGRHIVYERVNNYWGDDLPVNRGMNNIAEIRYDYYRDFGVMFEAFKSGDIDFRRESQSKRWATEYNFPAIKANQVVRATPADNSPQGIQGLLMNTRRPQFTDVRVREALSKLFDFEWTRKALLYNQYTRTASYFPNSDYGASGPPPADEITILEPFRDKLPPEVFTSAFTPSKTDGSGRVRTQKRAALKLLRAAGWTLSEGKLVSAEGKQMKLELLLVQPDFERLVSPFVDNLQSIGIDATMRIVDTSQYQNRTDDFDFDMISIRFNFFPPPGSELSSFYGSGAVDTAGSANMAGIRSTAVDALITKIIESKKLATLKQHTRALDRVLLSGHYMIPQWYSAEFRLAYWDRFGQPSRAPKYGIGFPSTWWVDPARNAKLPQLQR
jgi:microcin C transport system substrate-binding protein